MPEKKNAEKKYKEISEVSSEISIIDEKQINNADNLVYSEVNNISHLSTSFVMTTRSSDGTEKRYVLNKTPDFKNEFKYLNLFSLSSCRLRTEKGETVFDIAKDMKQFINDNYRTKPKAVERALMQLGSDFASHYDHGTGNILGISGFTRESQGDSFEQILGKILQAGQNEEVTGFVCSTISEALFQLLKECGIESGMLCGGADGSNHTVLLWKNSDGKFVVTDYGESYTLNSTDLYSAVNEIYKKGLGLQNNGYTYFVGMDGSVQKCNMGDVVAVGKKELDKSDYDNKSLFDNKVAGKSSINGTARVSNLESKNITITATFASENALGNVHNEKTFKLGAEVGNQSPISDSYKGFGGEYLSQKERVVKNKSNFSSTKFIANITTLKTDSYTMERDYTQPIEGFSVKDFENIENLKKYYEECFENAYSIEKLQKDIEDLRNEKDKININVGDETYTYDEFMNSDVFSTNDKKIVTYKYKMLFKDIDNKIAELEYIINNYDKSKQEFVDSQMPRLSEPYSYQGDTSKTVEKPGFSKTYWTTFVRQVFGQERTIAKGEHFELKNCYQVSGLLGLSKVFGSKTFGGDARITVEVGTQLNLHNNNTTFRANLSAGLVEDFGLKTGCLTPTINHGFKTNAGADVTKNINNNVVFGASAKAYNVRTGLTSGTGTQDWGGEVSLRAGVRLNNGNTIFGTGTAAFGKKYINVANFARNTLAEHETTLSGTLGMQFKNGNRVQFNVQDTRNHLNSSYNKQQYSVTAILGLGGR